MKKQWLMIAVALAVGATLVLVLLQLLGSGAGSPIGAKAAPNMLTVTTVNPASAANDLDTAVTISGTGFTAVPAVTLGSKTLADINWVSAEILTATVPWGMRPGIYDLTVINADGETAALSRAFTVTEGIGSWTSNGPYGGAVQQIVVNPAAPETAYAAVSFVGVFATFDGAEHWQPMLVDDNPIRLVLDAQDPAVVYSSGRRFLRSKNGGVTWEALDDNLSPPLILPQSGCSNLYPQAHPTQAGALYAAVGSCANISIQADEGGILYSEDYGESWITRTVGLTDTDVVDLAFHPLDPDQMAAATKSGSIFTSADGGQTWQWTADLDQPLQRIYFNLGGSHEAWIVPYEENLPPFVPYLYKSSGPDLTTWTTISVTDDLSYSGGIGSLAFRQGAVWAAGDQGYISDDGGATWAPIIDHGNINTIKSFAFPAGGSQTIYAGSAMDGVQKSVDGGSTWQEKNEGLAGLQVRGLAVPRAEIDTIYANTFERGILRSDDAGQNWQELIFFFGGAPKGQVLAADPFQPERVYYGDSCQDLPCMQVSGDRGLTWQGVTMTLPAEYAGWMGRTLTAAPHPLIPGRILAGAGFCRDLLHCNSGEEPSGIYTSDDYGQSWAFIGPSPAISEVLSIAYDSSDPDLIYAGTRGMGLWRSTNGGDSWDGMPFPGIQPPVRIESIAPHPDQTGTVYVRLYSYYADPNPQPQLFVSNDGGENWQELPDVHTVIGDAGGAGLIFMPPAPGAAIYLLYAGCGPGLCRTLAGSNNWELVAGAPGPTLGSQSMPANGDAQRARLYVGTNGGIAPQTVQTAAASETVPGLGGLLGGGVYRQTVVFTEMYLPAITGGK